MLPTHELLVEWVATFNLNDSEPASYDNLEDEWELGDYEDDEWDKLRDFMAPWTIKQQEIFLTEVMKMDTTKKGRCNYYISTSDSPRNFCYVQGLFISDGSKVFVGQLPMDCPFFRSSCAELKIRLFK